MLQNVFIGQAPPDSLVASNGRGKAEKGSERGRLRTKRKGLKGLVPHFMKQVASLLAEQKTKS